MTCHAMLARMLDAAPGELLGRGDTPLAAHVRGCARCRVVAAQLAADTAALVDAVRDEPTGARRMEVGQRRPDHGWAIWAGALTAAMLLAMAVWMSAPGPTRPETSNQTPRRPSAIVAGPPPAVAAPGPSLGATAREPAVGHLTPTPTLAAERFAAPQPVEPERLGGAGAVARRGARAAFAVHPPPGVRAAVLQTANPAITVVWLY